MLDLSGKPASLRGVRSTDGQAPAIFAAGGRVSVGACDEAFRRSGHGAAGRHRHYEPDGDGDDSLLFGQAPVWTLVDGVRTATVGDISMNDQILLVQGDFALKISSTGNIDAKNATFDVSASGAVTRGGGDGAGGTILINGSVVLADGATVNVEGGGTDPDAGGAGRLVFGANTDDPDFAAVTGETQDLGAGARGLNPFVKGEIETPFIPDLVGGAELFGLLDDVSADDAVFGDLHASAPGDAISALLRLDVGTTDAYDDDFVGFDILLFLNLSDGDLFDPLLGVDPAEADGDFMTALLQGGFLQDVAFGGDGDDILGLLALGEIYATLVPEDGTLFNFGANGRTASGILGNGEALFLTEPNVAPLPAPAFLLLGAVGLLAGAAAKRRRRERG